MKKQWFILSLLLLAATIGFSQTTINGTVTDVDTGEELIGANVLVKGTAIGTTTDFDGSFSLQIQTSFPLTLVVSYVGYETKEVEVKSARKPIKIKLDSGGAMLEECVVISATTSKRKRRRGKSKKYRVPRQKNPNNYQQQRPTPSPHRSIADTMSNTEDYDPIKENPFFAVKNEPLSTFSIDVDAASYSNMRRFINSNQMPPKDAIRIEEMVNYFEYSYPQPQGKHPFEVVTEISDCPWNDQHRLAHIGLQGKKINTEDLPASNLVFLIDVSGSMSSYNKLPLLQESYKLLADNLREKDKVAIVVYAGAAGVVLPSTNGIDKQKIKNAIDNLRAGGSTSGAAGIKLAYEIAQKNFVKDGNNRVILATDGDFNVGQSSDASLVRLIEDKRKSGVFLTVMGFGMGNYKDNKMLKLADSGNGNHAYIDNISEARKVLVKEFGGTLFTIAKDVKLQIEFNPEKVNGYRLIGYENRVLENEDFNDDKKDAGELGAGHTVTAIYEIIPAGTDSEFLAKVDKLKYQKSKKVKTKASKSGELMTVKLRYKKPSGSKSQLIEKPILDTNQELEQTSDNFRWSAAVATFGMLLRESTFKKDANYDLAIDLAKKSKGLDPNGYRAECIEMMEQVRLMSSQQTGMK